MKKLYIFVLMLSFLIINLNLTHGIVANAETSTNQPNATLSIAKPESSETALSNDAEFVQDTLPQTGVEANHSGLYFSIAGFFLVLAVFTSRSKTSSRYNVSDKQKK